MKSKDQNLSIGITRKLAKSQLETVRRVGFCRRTFFVSSLVVAGLVLQPISTAEAASGDAGFSGLIPYAFNFALYVAILYFLLAKKLKIAWIERSNAIESSVTKAARELEAAKLALSEAQSRVSNLEQETQQIITSMQLDSKREEQRILVEARQRAANIATVTQATAQAEQKAAIAAAKRDFVEQVIEKARTQLVTKVTAEQDSQRRRRAIVALKGSFAAMQN